MDAQQLEWQEYLESLPFFDNIPILVESLGDIENEAMRRLGALEGQSGKVGICVVLGTVHATPGTDAEVGPVLHMRHVARVIENVTINRDARMNGTLIRYNSVSEEIANVSQGIFRPVSGRAPFMLVAPGLREIDPQFLTHVPTGPGKDAFFECFGVLGAPSLPVLTLPVINVVPGVDPDPDTVEITCATPGAAIFYTLDGSRPRPGKTLYTGPFEKPAPGTVIQARAYLVAHLQPGSAPRDSIATVTV